MMITSTGQITESVNYVRCTSDQCRIYPPYTIDPNAITAPGDRAWDESRVVPPGSRLRVIGGAIVDRRSIITNGAHVVQYVPNRASGEHRYYRVRYVGPRGELVGDFFDGWIDARHVVAELPPAPAPTSNVTGPARRLGRGRTGPATPLPTDAPTLFAAWQRAKRGGKLPPPIIDSLYNKYSRAAAAEGRAEVPATYTGPLPPRQTGGAPPPQSNLVTATCNAASCQVISADRSRVGTVPFGTPVTIDTRRPYVDDQGRPFPLPGRATGMRYVFLESGEGVWMHPDQLVGGVRTGYLEVGTGQRANPFDLLALTSPPFLARSGQVVPRIGRHAVALAQLQQAQQLGQYAPDDADDLRDAIERLTVEVAELQGRLAGPSSTGYWTSTGQIEQTPFAIPLPAGPRATVKRDAQTWIVDPGNVVQVVSSSPIPGARVWPPHFYMPPGRPDGSLAHRTRARNGSRVIAPGSLVVITGGPYGPWSGRDSVSNLAPFYRVAYVGPSRSGANTDVGGGRALPPERIDGWMEVSDLVFADAAEAESLAILRRLYDETIASAGVTLQRRREIVAALRDHAARAREVGDSVAAERYEETARSIEAATPTSRLGRPSTGPAAPRPTDAATLFAQWQAAKAAGRLPPPIIASLYNKYSRAAAAEQRPVALPDYVGPLPQPSGGASSTSGWYVETGRHAGGFTRSPFLGAFVPQGDEALGRQAAVGDVVVATMAFASELDPVGQPLPLRSRVVFVEVVQVPSRTGLGYFDGYLTEGRRARVVGWPNVETVDANSPVLVSVPVNAVMELWRGGRRVMASGGVQGAAELFAQWQAAKAGGRQSPAIINALYNRYSRAARAEQRPVAEPGYVGPLPEPSGGASSTGQLRLLPGQLARPYGEVPVDETYTPGKGPLVPVPERFFAEDPQNAALGRQARVGDRAVIVINFPAVFGEGPAAPAGPRVALVDVLAVPSLIGPDFIDGYIVQEGGIGIVQPAAYAIPLTAVRELWRNGQRVTTTGVQGAAEIFAQWQAAKAGGRQSPAIINALYARYSRAARAEQRPVAEPGYVGPLPQPSGGASSTGAWYGDTTSTGQGILAAFTIMKSIFSGDSLWSSAESLFDSFDVLNVFGPSERLQWRIAATQAADSLGGGQQCAILPLHFIIPGGLTRWWLTEIASIPRRIPRGAAVEIIGPTLDVDVVGGNIGGTPVLHFIVKPRGQPHQGQGIRRTFTQVRHRYPDGSFYDGWLEQSCMPATATQQALNRLRLRPRPPATSGWELSDGASSTSEWGYAVG